LRWINPASALEAEHPPRCDERTLAPHPRRGEAADFSATAGHRVDLESSPCRLRRSLDKKP
jgi:hypothetical protein